MLYEVITDVYEYLGVARFSKDKWQDNNTAGVVTGLAWTAVGGEILFVESSLSKGKGKLTLTGNLGDVMKESAVLALEYLRANATKYGIKGETFDEWNVHVHVPEGAIPKDGPSAGITMATSLASSLTQRKVRQKLAMTGEITLRGKVLPVGGIKEKIVITSYSIHYTKLYEAVSVLPVPCFYRFYFGLKISNTCFYKQVHLPKHFVTCKCKHFY